MAKRIREEVWIDGEKHVVEREMTSEEYEAYVAERMAEHGAERHAQAVREANAHGRQVPTAEDYKVVDERDARINMILIAIIVAAVVLFVLFGPIQFPFVPYYQLGLD